MKSIPAVPGASPIHTGQPPRAHNNNGAKRYARWGALVGALVYLVALLSHVLVVRGIHEHPSPLMYEVLILPTQCLPNPWSQDYREFGWWMFNGFVFWILCLGCLGYGIGRVRELARQPATQA